MTDYKKYINALRKCAKEHEGDRTFTGQIIVSNLCEDVAELLEELEQEPCEDCCNGDQEEKAKLCQKSYLAGMEHRQEPCETQMIDKSNLSQEQYKADLQSAYDCGKASVKPCGDTISRTAAIKVASGYCHPSNIAKELAKLPPVTPIRPKGHWIEEKIGGHEVNVCSHCQHIQHKEPTWHYCPLCGADMREVEESEG